MKILAYEKSDYQTDYLVAIIHRLQVAGHRAGFATKTLCELGMDVGSTEQGHPLLRVWAHWVSSFIQCAQPSHTEHRKIPK